MMTAGGRALKAEDTVCRVGPAAGACFMCLVLLVNKKVEGAMC